MEELKGLLEGLDGADTAKVIEDIPIIMAKIKELGFLKVVEDEELKDFLPDIRDRIANIDLEELVPLAKVIMPAFFEGMQELLEASEEAQEELEDMEDVSVQMSVPTLDVNMFMVIKDGKFKAGAGTIEDAELKISMQKDTFLSLMKGEGDMVSAYMSGGVTMEGPLNKAMTIQSLFEILADEYDMDLGIM